LLHFEKNPERFRGDWGRKLRPNFTLFDPSAKSRGGNFSCYTSCTFDGAQLGSLEDKRSDGEKYVQRQKIKAGSMAGDLNKFVSLHFTFHNLT